MVAGGEIASFEASVIDVDGETSNCDVVRVGPLMLFVTVSI